MTEENEQRMERLFHDHYEQMYRFFKHRINV